jgi:hypothetical protein
MRDSIKLNYACVEGQHLKSVHRDGMVSVAHKRTFTLLNYHYLMRDSMVCIVLTWLAHIEVLKYRQVRFLWAV